MISEKIANLRMTLALAEARGININLGLVKALRRQLFDIHEQVKALEDAQVPTAQRVTLQDIESGKITYISREVPFQ